LRRDSTRQNTKNRKKKTNIQAQEGQVLNLFCVPGYAVANSLKYAQNPRKK